MLFLYCDLATPLLRGLLGLGYKGKYSFCLALTLSRNSLDVRKPRPHGKAICEDMVANSPGQDQLSDLQGLVQDENAGPRVRKLRM